MPQESRITIRDHEVSLALHNLDSRRKPRRIRTALIDDDLHRQIRSIRKPDSLLADLQDGQARSNFRAVLLRPLDQKLRRTRWIQHRIFRNEKPASHPIAQVWLKLFQPLRIEN